MTRVSTGAIVALLALLFAANVFAAEPIFAEPILLTSCGQAADVIQLRIMMSRDSLQFSYLPSATADDVTGKGSVIVVIGGSSKGLGAAKTSPEQEIARVTAILDAASKAGIPVIAVHLGGLNRRGALSDPFNQLGADAAARIIVVNGGNDDGFFTKIAEAKSAVLDTVTNVNDVGPKMKEIYRPAK